ncbi:MAG: NAD-dependent epimerase/dehydratase family protein [Candidatus Omnitrophica bacterium]|nr:NAD-dependent epimerase/dehydratase family protein [Candidatus Omnitrophota bacterium]
MKPEVLVTGASGFIGSHVVRRLAARGIPARVLVRQTSSMKALAGLPVEAVYGDLADSSSIRNAVRGCRFVYHVAADYRLWARNPQELYASNVRGTTHVLEAAWAEKVERIVYTSSVGALGLCSDGSAATEETPAVLEAMVGHYKRSKYLAEQEALRLARRGCPVVIVNPSTPVGSWDVKPTRTGQIVVDFLKGRMPGFVDTGLNLVDVEDVAEGHLLAMEKGRVGERYILGSKNMPLREILEVLGRLSGRPAPKMQVPWAVAYAAGCVSSATAWLTGRPPAIPLDGVRMARKKMYFDAGKAVRELGLPQHSVEVALEKAVEWFRQHGYVAA